MKKYALIVSLAILVIAVFVIAINKRNIINNPLEQTKKISLRLKWLDQAQFAGFYVANNKGLYKGKSLEIKEYCFGLERQFPYGLSGQRVYELKFYPESDKFEGEYQ